MPNPYEDFFGNQKSSDESPKEEHVIPPIPEENFPEDHTEPLDEILNRIKQFQDDANTFSKLLSQTRAVDHKVESGISKLFLVSENKFDQGSLAGEKKYHEQLTKKFRGIIDPMKKLAQLHVDTIRQFNNDIDEHYYSIEKEDRQVKSEKSRAIKGLNLQRQILADAASDLEILEQALESAERRIKKYIDFGGENNISASESSLIATERTALTSGRQHQFDFRFFNINMLDKTVISLGFFLKETSAQYLGKLLKAFEIKDEYS